jgi:hypothetical protein
MSTRRSYVIHPKPNADPVITRTIEPEIFPMLSTQKGFSNEPIASHTHTPLNSNFKLVGSDGVRRSLQPFVVPEVLKALSSLVKGTRRT